MSHPKADARVLSRLMMRQVKKIRNIDIRKETDLMNALEHALEMK